MSDELPPELEVLVKSKVDLVIGATNTVPRTLRYGFGNGPTAGHPHVFFVGPDRGELPFMIDFSVNDGKTPLERVLAIPTKGYTLMTLEGGATFGICATGLPEGMQYDELPFSTYHSRQMGISE